ncbi:LPXTG cell wall anchor domain-containing protein [Streptococcus suis]|nr:LPXTG cell wall anchor domain-containing protein [Streptococcus suis]
MKNANTHKEALTSASTVTVSSQDVEFEKTTDTALPRTNEQHSNLPILAGFSLLSLTVAKKRKKS